MIARSAKKILNFELTRLMLKAGNAVSDVEENVSNITQSQKTGYIKIFEQELKKITTAILNLIFGQSKEEELFWRTKLSKQIRHDFDYEIKLPKRVQNLPKGYFLTTICDHFNIQLDEQSYPGIGIDAAPFSSENITKFLAKEKVFKFKKHKFRMFTEGADHAIEERSYGTAMKMLYMKLYMEESLGRVEEFLDTLCEIADLHLEMDNHDLVLDVVA
jgi:hypothetical protein